ncbi:MAG: ABC transporter ATP-binding protein [Oligoflexia bacterium]|nr:ABC transporter ATP-binding protein [Oligoflexia bacterium]
MNPTFLQISDLEFSIGEASILNGISCQVPRGETVGIIGPNGSGKTTLFNCISGFNLPSRGRIIFDATDITAVSPHTRALHGLGRVFQNSGVFRELSVEENMLTALESRDSLIRKFFPARSHRAQRRQLAREFLSEINLDAKSSHKAGSLSGGQLRLLEIVRTLAFGAEVFLLDEPTAGVSPRMKEDVAGLIAKLQQRGKTILVIEHDINFIQKFCQRILVLDGGRVVMDGPPDTVRSDRRLQEIYFGNKTQSES